MMFVLAGLSSCGTLGLVLLLFSYFDVTPRPSTSVGYCKGFCLNTSLGNKGYFHFKLRCQSGAVSLGQ